MASTRPRMIERLPAVLRTDEVDGRNFLADFLEAFELVQREAEHEIERVPDLLSVVPTPVLREAAHPREAVIDLDSAAGLRPGHVLEIADRQPERVEFVEVAEIRYRRRPEELVPVAVRLRRPLLPGGARGRALRFEHAEETPLRVLGRPVAWSALAVRAARDERRLTLRLAGELPLAAGDVLALDQGEQREFVRVTGVEGARVTFEPPLQRGHGAERPVALVERAPVTTPPHAFPYSEPEGPEMVLQADVLAGHAWVELDTVTGLRRGDLLHLRDRDPRRVEFVRVRELPRRRRPRGPGVVRRAVELAAPLRHPHDAGIGVSVVGPARTRTVLAEEVRPRTCTTWLGAQRGIGPEGVDPIRSFRVREPDVLDAEPGDVLRVGDVVKLEHVQVESVAGDRLTVTPGLVRLHDPGRSVTRLAPAGSGTAFLRWLAGWVGLALRPDRGERWNRELVRAAPRMWSWRGTRRAVEAFLRTYLRGEAVRTAVLDAPNPMQVEFISTVGVDSFVGGMLPHFFELELWTDQRSSRLYSPRGLAEMVQAARAALRTERPAHTYYDLRINGNTMQLGVEPRREIGARVGDTTLVWNGPLVVEGER